MINGVWWIIWQIRARARIEKGLEFNFFQGRSSNLKQSIVSYFYVLLCHQKQRILTTTKKDNFLIILMNTWYLLFAVEPVLLIVSLWHSKPSRTCIFQGGIICEASKLVLTKLKFLLTTLSSMPSLFLRVWPILTIASWGFASHNHIEILSPCRSFFCKYFFCQMFLLLLSDSCTIVSFW